MQMNHVVKLLKSYEHNTYSGSSIAPLKAFKKLILVSTPLLNVKHISIKAHVMIVGLLLGAIRQEFLRFV